MMSASKKYDSARLRRGSRPRYGIAVGLAVLLIFLAVPGPVRADLDPPAPPAYQEVIWLTNVVVRDDMDTFFAGELSVDYFITQPGHPGVTGRIPAAGTVGLNAPPPVAFPAPYPVVLYNHLNCSPLERPLAITLLLNDDDLTTVETSPLSIAVGAANGVFGAVNREFAFGVVVGVFRAPQFDALCGSTTPIPPGSQPQPPPAPATPAIGDPETPVPPPPSPDDQQKTMEGVNAALTQALPPQPFLNRPDAALTLGLIVGAALGLLLCLLLRARRPRPR